MSDVFDKHTRSNVMSKIRKTNTKPEILVRKFLFNEGFRFRIYVKKLPGNPDIVLSKLKTIIFVNGCFWHQHKSCRFGKLPKTRKEYWHPKILRNIDRDKKNKRVLLIRKEIKTILSAP